MSLLLDLGNTRLKAAWLRAGSQNGADAGSGERLRRGTADAFAFAHSAPDFEAQLNARLERETLPGPTIAWLAAVAPDAAVTRIERVLRAHEYTIRHVATQAEALGLRVAYADPTRLGVDRWLAMLGARATSSQPVLVANVGSALTLDAVDAQGQHLGGLIAPPPEAMRAALVARAPRLDVNAGSVQRFAASTEDAIASGCVLSAAALIERSVAELATRCGVAPRLLLSGGGAEALRPWLPEHEVAPHLVLDGLACWVAQCEGMPPLR